MDSSDILLFGPVTPTATFGLGRTEAEDLDIQEGFTVQSNGAASGGAVLQATGSDSEVAGVFDGPAGTYDLTVGYFDETDGVSSMEVLVNGIVVQSFDWDSLGGTAIANTQSAAEEVVMGLALAPGDVVTLRGMQDGGEPLRTDYIELAAASAPPPGPGAFMVEAEDLTIVSGFEVQPNGAASGGAMLQDDFVVGPLGIFTAVASYTVAQTGVFDLRIDYFDETDGVSNLEVRLNGNPVGSFLFDGTGGSAIANAASRAFETIAGLSLAVGDVIELVGNGDAGEPLRIDKLTFEPAAAPPPPPPTSFVIEAEDLTIVSGFTVASNGAASGGETLQDNTSSGESRASYTMTQNGVFDLTIGYFDETDGVSTLRVLVNGVEVDSFDWDSTSGSSIANGASAAEFAIPNLLLSTGDVVEIAGFGDGGEPLRVDFLRFDASVIVPPPPILQTPDIWYEDFGDIVVATNDGTGTFTELVTGINTENGIVKSGDFNGDGIVDFVQVNAIGLPVMTADPTVNEQEVEITVFLNDGAANFVAQPTQTVFSPISTDIDGTPAFQFQDVGDFDGDGDLDLLAGGTATFENLFFLYENDGTGGFSHTSTENGSFDGFLTQAFFADLNADDNDDVVFFGFGSGAVLETYISDGAGGLTLREFISPGEGGIGDQQVVDLDGDLDLDFVFSTSEEDRSITAFENDGTGLRAFEGAPRIFGDENGTIGASVAADFDGDGDIEIISAGTFDEDDNPEGLRVFDVMVAADGIEFVLKSTDASITGNAVAFADFDLDGDLDVLLTPPNSLSSDPDLSLLTNDGLGNFTDSGLVIPSFFTQDFSFAPVVTVEFFDDPLI